ncbi:protein disulfide-isomerase A2 [Dromaius novaehollandiae]|uniref:protein disulfide-isomerase A2 n=1 Tax=Dromaius novaehollandiae TaxID=8790 RepID=UPI00311FFE96
MRGSGARRLWLLVLALAWLGPARGAGVGPGDEAEDGEVAEEEEVEEVLSDELGEEDGVLVLHEHNFARALREHRLLLVEFYARWCRHCQALAPQFAQAAATLRNESGELRLAKVDAPAQAALSREFGITAYPTLKLFRDGNRTHPANYTGRLDAQGIVRWMQRRAGPSAELLQDTAAAAAFVTAQDVAVVGFFKDLRGEAAQAFYELAGDLVDVAFGAAEAPELFEAYGLAADTVCVFKKFDEERADFPLDPARGLDAAELSRFIRVHSLELLMEFTSETSDRIFDAKIPHHMLLFLNKTEAAQLELQGPFREAAAAFRGKVLFVLVDVSGYGAGVLPFFGLTPADAPTLRFVKMETNRKYQMEEDAFSASAVSAFVQAVLDGKVKPNLLSAEPPEDWDTKPVKVLVGKTFEQVAFDETKNVFVKFYAPWCSHCKEMAAAWEELGERYKDHEDIVIAEMDATANEMENIAIRGYPRLYYFPAGPGRKMIEYKSNRDVETFSKFLENRGTLPEEPPVVPETPKNATDTEEPSPPGTAETRDEL